MGRCNEGDKKMNFPIIEIKDSKITNKAGQVSFAYDFRPIDFDQVSIENITSYLELIKNTLLNFKANDYIRIYSKNNELLLVSNSDKISIPSVVLEPHLDPLGFYFESNEFLSDVKISDDYVHFNGRYFKFINIREFPATISENHLVDLGCDFIMNLTKINNIKQAAILSDKEGTYRGKEKHSKSFKSQEESNNALTTLKDISSELASGSECLFKTEIWLVVSAITKEEVFEKTNIVFESLLTHKLYLESIALSDVFIENIPGVYPSFSSGRDLTIHSSFASALLPLSKDMLMKEGFTLHSRDGVRLYFSHKDRSFMNKNSFIAGPTGSGKSLLVQHIIERDVENGDNVIVLDKGESYKKLCMYHSGLLLNGKINFLTFKGPQYLTDLVLEIAGKDEFTKNQKGEMYAWIEEGVKNDKFNTHDEFINYLEIKFEKIKFYFSDIRKFLTDEEVSLDNKFIYCEVKNYPSKIRGAVILFLFQFFDNFKGRVTFVFEEIHNYLLTTPDSIVGTISREIRKEGGALVSVTQSVNDTDIYPLLNVLWENAQHKYLFQHETIPSETFIKGHARELFLSLADNQIRNNHNYESSKKGYSEFLLSSGGFLKIVRLYVSKQKYELYTSDDEDKQNFNSWFEMNQIAFGTFKDAIESYTRMKYEN